MHTINKNTTKQFGEEDIVRKQEEILEESQRAVEIDFIKQNQKFRERLAMRTKAKIKILPKELKESEWGNESSIKLDSTIKK